MARYPLSSASYRSVYTASHGRVGSSAQGTP